MTIQRKHCFEGGTILSYPVFIPAEDADRRERENAERMSGFYEYLKTSILEYSASNAFPTGGKYYADFLVRETVEGWIVELFLRLRVRGRTIGSRHVIHTWRDGVLEKEKQGGLQE